MTTRAKLRFGWDHAFSFFFFFTVTVTTEIYPLSLHDALPIFKDRANKSAAQANVRAVLPDVESYNADNVPGGTSDPDAATSTADSGYQGMTAAELKTSYDQAFPTAVWIIGSNDVSATPVAPPTGTGITAAG